jgi:nitrite reductase (NO-forming)
MKCKAKLFQSYRMLLLVFVVFFSTISTGFACEACNRIFLAQLGAERAGSLASRQLLATIAAHKSTAVSNPSWVDEVIAANDITLETGTMPGMGTSGAARNVIPNVNKGQSGYSGGSAAVTDNEFVEIIRRDEQLGIPVTSYVPQDTPPDKKVRISLEEGDTYIGNGVMYHGFTTDGKIPGPTVIVDEGDIVEFTIVNKGNIPHGASIHAAYTQTSKYLGKINPDDSATIVFRATLPGVYMYHCAPGGHAIPMHIIFGQYGMMVVKPKEKYELERVLNKEPDIELYLVQHEYYASGKDAVDGQGRPMYTAFNGKLFRYVEEPVVGRPGDYVRINFLNVGPNLVSTFHIVGIIWDFAYWQGHPDNRFTGGQSVTAGPSDSWVVEFRIPPDEGSYLMLSHAVGSTDRGALGLLVCDENATPPGEILADGIVYSESEMDEFREKASRTITPFGIGSPDVDVPVVYKRDVKEVVVRIIGNSYHPKVIHVTPGTRVTWINEDVFTFMEGEFSGIHNALVKDGPERFASPMLAHAEKYTHEMTQEGEYNYICTPHPYMEGKIIVKADEPGEVQVAAAGIGATSRMVWFVLILAALALMIALIGLINK